MKQTVNSSDFIDAFRVNNRQDQFSYSGLHALFEYLEEIEQDTGTELELDVIALCCDYSEHASAFEASREYGRGADEDDGDSTEEEREEAALEWLRDQTQVIPHDKGVIIQSF